MLIIDQTLHSDLCLTYDEYEKSSGLKIMFGHFWVCIQQLFLKIFCYSAEFLANQGWFSARLPQSLFCIFYNYTPLIEVWRGVYWNRHGCPPVCPWTQFCLELFSYVFAHTALKFIHNVWIHMKLCMCNFHDHTIIGYGTISPWTCKFYWIIVVLSFSPTVLHVLL